MTVTARRLAGVAVLAATTIAYVRGLDVAPVSLDGDEAHFGAHAYAIARTGRDLNGSVMPLFFNLWDPQGDPAAREQNDARKTIWYQPVLFYLIALVLKVAPLTEASIRLPTAMIAGCLNPLLMYALALRLFGNRFEAAVAAVMLAFTPASFILGRQAVDYICLVPFVLGWLWCLAVSLEEGGVWLPLAGGFLLGVGLFSFIAAWILMPVCLALSWIAYYRAGQDWDRASLGMAAGFALPLLFAIPWLLSHPQMPRDILARYVASGGEHSVAGPAGSRAFSFMHVRDRISIYWDYFDPSFLFLTGAPSLTASTGRAGVFLMSLAVWLPLGFYELLRRATTTTMAMVLLGGLLWAPIPATLVGEGHVVQRELFVLPFAVLVATFGFARLWRSPRRGTRAATLLLLAAMPLQFAIVYRDYFTHYRLRSAFWYDPAAFQGVAEYLIAADVEARVPTVYLSRDLDDGGPKWRFYTAKHSREDLLQRTSYVDGDGTGRGLEGAAQGSLLVVYAQSTPAALTRSGQWSLERTVSDVDGRPATAILRKVR